MARANLSALLGNVEQAPAPAGPVEEPPSISERSAASAAPVQVAKRRPPAATPVRGEPPYLRLVRKETRLREEQYAALTQHARRLSRARRSAGERITENTLIRIAIDLLLERIDAAQGVSETELRESLR